MILIYYHAYSRRGLTAYEIHKANKLSFLLVWKTCTSANGGVIVLFQLQFYEYYLQDLGVLQAKFLPVPIIVANHMQNYGWFASYAAHS